MTFEEQRIAFHAEKGNFKTVFDSPMQQQIERTKLNGALVALRQSYELTREELVLPKQVQFADIASRKEMLTQLAELLEAIDETQKEIKQLK